MPTSALGNSSGSKWFFCLCVCPSWVEGVSLFSAPHCQWLSFYLHYFNYIIKIGTNCWWTSENKTANWMVRHGQEMCRYSGVGWGGWWWWWCPGSRAWLKSRASTLSEQQLFCIQRLHFPRSIPVAAPIHFLTQLFNYLRLLVTVSRFPPRPAYVMTGESREAFSGGGPRDPRPFIHDPTRPHAKAIKKRAAPSEHWQVSDIDTNNPWNGTLQAGASGISSFFAAAAAAGSRWDCLVSEDRRVTGLSPAPLMDRSGPACSGAWSRSLPEHAPEICGNACISHIDNCRSRDYEPWRACESSWKRPWPARIWTYWSADRSVLGPNKFFLPEQFSSKQHARAARSRS